MNEITQVLNAIQQGDPQAADQLLPLVYDELRRLAEAKMAGENPGHTLQPTALVHEAYLRLVQSGAASASPEQYWDGRAHFFAAAAEAMRRILVDTARRKKRDKHGGGRRRVEVDQATSTGPGAGRSAVNHGPDQPTPDKIVALDEEIIALDEALRRLAKEDPVGARVVQLHFFAGLPIDQIADMLTISRATAYRQWSYARAWLRCAIEQGEG
jgi:RNA polymerase sigma factor (sigma-70 family)